MYVYMRMYVYVYVYVYVSENVNEVLEKATWRKRTLWAHDSMFSFSPSLFSLCSHTLLSSVPRQKKPKLFQTK